MEENIDTSKFIFVFGSNEGGHHGAGAALFAYKHKGADYSRAFGRSGQSFAIPTKDRTIRKTLSLLKIKGYVDRFIQFATDNPHLKFQVTCIGCGLAGLRHELVSEMFQNAPDNCYFDTQWEPFLGKEKNYWGTF